MAISQIYDMSARQVWVGRYDEHGSREVAWDVSPWTSKLGSDGVFALLVTRPRDTDSPYNAQVSFDASTNLVTWAVTDVDTALKGWGRAELHYYVDGALVKSQTFVTIIEKAMFAGSTAPSAAESWVERMEQAALDAQAAAETAEDAETTATSAATTATSAAATAITAANSASSSASSARADATTATNAATAAALSESAASTSATNAAASAEAASTSALTASTAASTATTKASQASASASTAATAATTATNKASEATTAAQTATTKAGEASTSASTATSAKDTAVSASQTATTKATEATTAAATATSAATTATTAKDDAVSAKTAAQTAQTGAETAAASVQSSAAQIATNAADISQLKSELTAVGDNLISNSKHLMSDTYIDLFDKNDADFLTGEGYYGTSGTIVADTQSCLTGYIPVVAGEVVKTYYNYNNTRENFLTSQVIPHKIGFYNSAKEWMKTVVDFSGYSSGELTIEQTGYIRIHYYWLSAYLEIYKNSVRMISVDSVKNAISSEELLTGNPINWLDPDSTDYLMGYGYSGTTGAIVEASTYSISNYVQVYKGNKLSIPYSDGTSFFTSTASSNYRKIAYYDKEKQWIKTISFFSTAIPFDSDSVDLEFDGYIRIQFLNSMTPVAIQIEGFNEIGDIYIGKSNVSSKLWYAIGDSITDGRYSYMNGSTATTGTDHTSYYGYIAGELLGLDVIEQGYGGLGFISTAGDGTNLTDILATDFENPTLITVCLGINDMGATTGDENSTALDGTWSGAVRNACEVLGAKYPNAQIVFLSPINANNHGSQATIWSRKATAQNNLDAQREILKHWCDVYNYKFIDMTVECPINAFNIVSLFPDKLHPSKTAHKMIGRWLAGALPFRNI